MFVSSCFPFSYIFFVVLQPSHSQKKRSAAAIVTQRKKGKGKDKGGKGLGEEVLHSFPFPPFPIPRKLQRKTWTQMAWKERLQQDVGLKICRKVWVFSQKQKNSCTFLSELIVAGKVSGQKEQQCQVLTILSWRRGVKMGRRCPVYEGEERRGKASSAGRDIIIKGSFFFLWEREKCVGARPSTFSAVVLCQGSSGKKDRFFWLL